MENYSNNSSDYGEQSDNESVASNSDINSLNSERLEREFQKVMDTKSDVKGENDEKDAIT